MDATGWTTVVVAAIGAVGTFLLQALHMYLSYKRDTEIKRDVETVAEKTNGLTEKIVGAELAAERIVAKAAEAAKELLNTAAVKARDGIRAENRDKT